MDDEIVSPNLGRVEVARRGRLVAGLRLNARPGPAVENIEIVAHASRLYHWRPQVRAGVISNQQGKAQPARGVVAACDGPSEGTHIDLQTARSDMPASRPTACTTSARRPADQGRDAASKVGQPSGAGPGELALLLPPAASRAGSIRVVPSSLRSALGRSSGHGRPTLCRSSLLGPTQERAATGERASELQRG